MSRSDNQKLKLCYIMKILSECTSRDDGITMPELIDRLDEYGIAAERKSIYRDINAINEFGEYMTIRKYRRDAQVYYYADDRMLTLADIKILADVIAASKFVTEKRSQELIRKLERMVSAKERRELNRSVYIRKHALEDDDDGYSNVDAIQTAIRENRQIAFTYLQWDTKLQLVPREQKVRTGISPWWLVYNNENYYLGAYDGARKSMRTYRVDKMRDVTLSEVPREGREAAEKTRPDLYAQARFEMFDGVQERVRVSCPAEMLGTFVDKIGRDITVMKKENGLELSFSVVPNRFFFGWLLALGNSVRLLSPQHCIDEMEMMCMSMINDHDRCPIKAVVFDLGGVLIRLRPEEYMRDNGFTPDEIKFIMDNVMLKAEWQKMDEGVLSQEDAIAIWSKKDPRYADAVRRYFAKVEQLIEPFPDTEELLVSLKEQGYRVYALTNYPKELFALHESKSMPFLRLMDGYIVSGREVRFKPNADFYELFLDKFGLKAGECVFIDDRDDNIQAAQALGMHAVSARNRDLGVAELKAFLAVHPPA
ncbi:MAG: HAD-IA family hydrolase [Lachnospiraceae bacterium]|nr:HAD-IA family hydrolase [Lachnospiraceae bacterium]